MGWKGEHSRSLEVRNLFQEGLLLLEHYLVSRGHAMSGALFELSHAQTEVVALSLQSGHLALQLQDPLGGVLMLALFSVQIAATSS